MGRLAPAARAGFQVHCVERGRDMRAIGARLPADAGPELDVVSVDVAVMVIDWEDLPTALPEKHTKPVFVRADA